MKSIGQMIQELHDKLDEIDREWPHTFISDIYDRTSRGRNTQSLNEKQIDKIEEIYAEFG
jgi:hypothetical protein